MVLLYFHFDVYVKVAVWSIAPYGEHALVTAILHLQFT